MEDFRRFLLDFLKWIYYNYDAECRTIVDATGSYYCLSSAKLGFDMFLEKKNYKVLSILGVKPCLDKMLCDYIRKSKK